MCKHVSREVHGLDPVPELVVLVQGPLLLIRIFCPTLATINIKPSIHPPCNNAATKHCNSSSLISEGCCNTIIHSPCNNYKSQTTAHTLRLLHGGCMIVLQQPSLITLETVATLCCNSVARWLYAGL